MTRIRVLELVKGLDIGGSETLLVQRLRVSDRSAFDYRVGYLEPGRSMLVDSIPADVPVMCLDAARHTDWRWVWNLRRYLCEEKIDVVNVHSPLMSSGVRLAVRSIPKKTRPVMLTTEHSVKHHWATERLSLMTVRLDDVVIAVSEPVAQSKIALKARSCQTIHHGVDTASLREVRRDRESISQEYGLSKGLTSILSVANFRPEKGHLRLLNAAQELRRERQDFCFYVAGHGPLEDWVRNEVDTRGMRNYYKVMGLVPNASRLIACADIFVLASDWEGRPVSLMEAMAAGVPSVATAVGGVPEMMESGVTGQLIEPKDPDALTSALRMMLEDPVRTAQLGAAAAESAKSFDMRMSSQRIEALYSSLLRTR